MRRRLATAVLLAGVIAGSLAAPAVPAEIVDAADALDHVGTAVTIEGDVALAHSDAESLVLELAPVGEKSFRAVLVRSLISSLPRSPERIYEGKRVRVSGIVQKFQGRPEMILESPSQIDIVDVAGAPVASTTSVPAAVPTTLRPLATTPPAAARPSATAAPAEPAPAPSAPAAPPPAAAPSSPASGTAAPATVVVPPIATPPAAAPAPAPPSAAPSPEPAAPAASAPPATVPPSEPEPKPLLAERLAAQACERARARWTEAAARARAAADELTRCIDRGSFACRESAAKLAPALGDLEWAEQQASDRCD